MIKIEADLRELMGHTPFEVYIGAALGIGMAWLWIFLAGLKF
jgi:acid phosphatase family membrane protein YuiD